MPDQSLTVEDLVSEITQEIADGAVTAPARMTVIAGGFVQTTIDKLVERGVLALTPEWDVEYLYPDGSTSSYTDTADAFEQALTREPAVEIADQYNAIDDAPGSARTVVRYVTNFRPVEV